MLVFALLFAAACGLETLVPLWPAEADGVDWPIGLGAVAVTAGTGITIWCLGMFARIGTGIMPDRPARQLVTTGPYAWSRNPMFVGFALMHAGGALLLGSVWALAALPLAIAVVSLTVVRHEEVYMHRTFGAAYEAYALRVHRWVGRRRVALDRLGAGAGAGAGVNPDSHSAR